MKRPLPSEYFEFYAGYISLVKNENVIKELQDQVLDLQVLISSVPTEKEDHAYVHGKWTIKEVIGHIIDTERIMAYRAFRISRKDKTSLSGFDENIFIANSNFNHRSLYDLAHEFSLMRESNIVLFKSFSEEMINEMGVANGKDISVRALLYIIVGHTTHHMNVIRDKYLK
jgi:DinB family protein